MDFTCFASALVMTAFCIAGCTSSKHAAEIRTVHVEDTLSMEGLALHRHAIGDIVCLPVEGERRCTSYRIRTIEEDRRIHVHYIHLDGRKLPLAEVYATRGTIMASLAQGIPFGDLVRRYNMDGSLTGELRWSPERSLVAEFTDEVRSHPAGDIFLVDVPSNQWYYVVRKDDPDRVAWTYGLVRVR